MRIFSVKMSIKKKLRDFCKDSTLHGMHYVYISKNWFDRSVWISAIACCAVVAFVACRAIWIYYVTDPIVTLVQNTHLPTSEIPFPSVLLCPQNNENNDYYMNVRSKELSDILRSHGFEEEAIKDYYAGLIMPVFMETKNEQVDLQIHRFLRDTKDYDQYYKVLDKLLKPCEEMLVKCVWRSKEYNCSDMFQRVVANFGYCCRFDLKYFSERSAETGIALNINNSHTLSKFLYMVLNSQEQLLNGESEDGLVKLYIVEDEDPITIFHQSLEMPPGYTYVVSFDVQQVITSNYVKSLPRNMRKCLLPGQDSGDIRSHYACIGNAMADYTMDHCFCVPVLKTGKHSSPYKNCTWDQYRCISKYIQIFRFSDKDTEAYATCENLCDYVTYSPQVHYTKWTRKRIPVKNTSDINYFSDGSKYLEVSVRFKERACIKYIRDILFTWDQLLASFGGIFGLALGGSIFSVIEIIWLLLDIAVTFVIDQKNKRIMNKENLHKNKEIKPKIAWEQNTFEASVIPFTH